MIFDNIQNKTPEQQQDDELGDQYYNQTKQLIEYMEMLISYFLASKNVMFTNADLKQFSSIEKVYDYFDVPYPEVLKQIQSELFNMYVDIVNDDLDLSSISIIPYIDQIKLKEQNKYKFIWNESG